MRFRPARRLPAFRQSDDDAHHPRGQLDTNTPQTPGMSRAEAISHAKVGAQKLWAGTVVVQPNSKTGPHHHGELETPSEHIAFFERVTVAGAQNGDEILAIKDPLHVQPNTEQMLAVILSQKGDTAGALQHLQNCLTYFAPGPNLELVKQQIAQLEPAVAPTK